MSKKQAHRPKLTARCILCKKKVVLTESQIKAAQSLGMAMCEKCGMPMTIERVHS